VPSFEVWHKDSVMPVLPQALAAPQLVVAGIRVSQ
jgi:hypothetical protein